MGDKIIYQKLGEPDVWLTRDELRTKDPKAWMALAPAGREEQEDAMFGEEKQGESFEQISNRKDGDEKKKKGRGRGNSEEEEEEGNVNEIKVKATKGVDGGEVGDVSDLELDEGDEKRGRRSG